MVSPAFRHLRTRWVQRRVFGFVDTGTCTVPVCVVCWGIYLQMLSMEMSRSCSYMEGWLFLLEWVLRVDWECSLVTWIFISLPPVKKKKKKQFGEEIMNWE